MSKRIFKMIVPLQGKLGLRKNTRNIHKSINRVPCDSEYYNQPLESVDYVNQELAQYPFPKRVSVVESNKREQALKEKVRQNFLKDKESRLLRLALKLQKKLSYLQLQQLKQLIPSLSRKQTRKHEKQLKMVSYKIKYSIQKGEIAQNFLLEQAKDIVRDIQKALNTNTNKLY